TLSSCDCNNNKDSQNGPAPTSSLGHWPVQIRLIPAHAPFLNNADILILADCAAVAYAALHQELLSNRVVMMGCPKFDDLPDYEERFTEMFTKNEIKSVTVVTMEVPCCSGLPVAVKNALQKAGKISPLKEIVINLKGEILK
ncbi:MAG: 4Fe-4S ferredoxin, partial [Deltaproteobacteria bacterium]|nr:4Fe-4S ferredoxin [Candidatus Tharpella sp.]